MQQQVNLTVRTGCNMQQIPGKFQIKLNQLLEYTSQEEIFRLIFKVYPEEGEFYNSPFRVDHNPDCYFILNDQNKLKFVDWGNPDYTHLDCFEAIKLYYGLTTYLEVIHTIYDALLANQRPGVVEGNSLRIPMEKMKPHKTEIKILKRDFSEDDERFWSQFGITEEQLILDQVFPVAAALLDTRKGLKELNFQREIVYCDDNFSSGNRKLYFPKRTKEDKFRFITNCNNNDIGGISQLDYQLDYILITKSHKDYRVLKNMGILNVVYFSNEGQIPKKEVLEELLLKFKFVYILYDNDSTGIKAAINLKTKVYEASLIHAEIIILSYQYKSKDASDLYKAMGAEKAYEIIKNLINNESIFKSAS